MICFFGRIKIQIKKKMQLPITKDENKKRKDNLQNIIYTNINLKQENLLLKNELNELKMIQYSKYLNSLLYSIIPTNNYNSSLFFATTFNEPIFFPNHMKISYINEVTCNLFGYTQSELLEQNYSKIYPKFSPQIISKLQSVNKFFFFHLTSLLK